MDSAAWTRRVRWELARRSVGKELADIVLAEVDQHCADSGEEAKVAFGEPGAFADTVLKERVPVAERADRDRFGLTTAQRRSEVIAQMGLLVTVFSAFVWITGGLMLRVTAAGLAGTLLLAAAVLGAFYVIHELRASGRRRSVLAAWWCAIVVFGGLAAFAFTQLPKTELGRFPTPVITVVGVAMLWWALTRKAPSKPLDTPIGDEQWLAQLRSLLQGRHGISGSRATELVDDAAAHLRASGESWAKEFGPVDEYAVELAEAEQRGR